MSYFLARATLATATRAASAHRLLEDAEWEASDIDRAAHIKSNESIDDKPPKTLRLELAHKTLTVSGA